ncbi:MAG: glycoside hydrolase family 2 TIM barrel-domain containing protein, partial [Puniceicoccaceae bacterium]
FDASFTNADLNLRVFTFRHENDDYFAPSPPFEVTARLSTLDGELVTEWTETVTVMGPHNGRDVQMKIPVQRPLHWTAETPNLYNLDVELSRDGAVIHTWSDRIGFREISTEGGVFRINGNVVKLRGVNRHDQHPEVGRATRHEHWLEDIQLMKAANINAVRMAHYPHAEGFVRLCDELGLYVLNEIPLGFGGDRMGKPEFAEGMLLRIHETIDRDRNRPSVVVWDFGNEDPFTRLHLVGLKVIKGLDSTRPVLLPFRFDDNLPPEVDILAPHYWKTDDYDRLAAEARRPVITTEFTHAIGHRDFGEMQQRWEALTKHPAGAGGFIWLWADQGLKRPVGDRPVFHPMEDKDKYTREGGELVREMHAGDGFIYDSHGNYGSDGIINADRSPQRDYWEVKAVYAPVRVLVDQLDWRPGQGAIHIPVRNDYDFTNLEGVSFDWTLYRKHLPLDSGSQRIEAEPHTTAELIIPIESEHLSGEEGPLYLHVSAVDSEGHRLMRQSVRLGNEPVRQPSAVAAPVTLNVETGEDDYMIRAGQIAYTIGKGSGELEAISIDGTILAEGGSFFAWRPSTYAERNRYDRRKNAPDWNTFMQGLEPIVEFCRLEEEASLPTIVARSVYRHDDTNAVTVDYRYSILEDGSLEVSFTAHVDMDVPELPELGLSWQPTSGLDRFIWLGQGPLESVPGKTAATCYGWWAGAPGSSLASGTKSGLDWAKLDYFSGHQLHFHGQEGVRLLQNKDGSSEFRVITKLGGAWTKNGPPEYAPWHLNLEASKVFEGRFVISPLGR